MRTPWSPSSDARTCRTCGRAMDPRARWAAVWDEVRFCSRRCRSEKPGILDAELERALISLLAARAGAATVCPSEATRAVRPDGWRPLLERTRRAARRLHARGVVEIVQGGRAVDPSSARGPIRIRRGPSWDDR